MGQQVGAEWRWQPDAQGGQLRPLGPGPDTDHFAGAPLAALIRTSGSSGPPKVAMLTRAAVLAAARRVTADLAFGSGDVWLGCLPRQHIGGLSIGYRCWLAGATWHLLPGYELRAVARALAEGAITHLSLVPPMLAALLDAEVPPPPSLRVAMIGGQALDAALARRALTAGWPLYVSYGMSETGGQIATTRYTRPGEDPRIIGLPAPELELELAACAAADADPLVVGQYAPEQEHELANGTTPQLATARSGAAAAPASGTPDAVTAKVPTGACDALPASDHAVSVAPGKPAPAQHPVLTDAAAAQTSDARQSAPTAAPPAQPLRLRGALLMAGYANPQRRPGDGLDDGWFTTSDLACRDAQGRLRVLGRADEVLVIGGINVLPAAVEAQLATAPGVRTVAVVGVPHPVWGATLAAGYVGSIGPEALRAWCRDHLPKPQQPRVVLALEQLPLLESGKLDRQSLRTRALTQLPSPG